ncbi:Fasciclin-domain-containing protein [Sistotremastrum suecicum HHB10207 ss-3]|uniref:Fasciclin-domain-containing protein n=1 Tax=Sistotremastrum suecicum HHB10207 ss-3 TaxID=1314776 RepID=A0A165YC60_9AGAM|nr:Fasciclin-domain-containing protein [Sistotremastrum suecicum HHB10207 ss-3]
MRSAVALAVLAGPALVLGQTVNTTFVAELLQFLEAANLTSLATVAQSIANTTTGERILASISNGTWTIFAPNDHAFTGVPANISSNPDLLADVLSYHVVPGTVNASDFFNNSDTIIRTLYNDSSRVFLEGGLSQVLALKTESGNVTHVLNQNTPTSILQSTTVGNITVHIVDSVIDIPGNLTAAAAANNLTGAATALQQANLLTTLETAHGITIFAPNDAAFTKALQAFGSSPPNASVLSAVLANHVINGSSVYSTELVKTNTVSAGGESFNFTVNSTGTFVQSGNITGKVLIPDIILENGVLHVIDTVLLNTANDTSAASSAYVSFIPFLCRRR